MLDTTATPPRAVNRAFGSVSRVAAFTAALAFALACALGLLGFGACFGFGTRAALAEPVQVTLSVPTEVPCAVLADGTVVGPSSWSVSSPVDAPANLSRVSVSGAPESVSFSAVKDDGSAAFSYSDGAATLSGGLTVPARGSASLSWDFSQLDAAKCADVLADAASGVGTLCGVSMTFTADPVAFAVYSDDDKSLRFYKRTVMPSVGSTFKGRTVTEVYTGFENKEYGFGSSLSETTTPWSAHNGDIEAIAVEDDGVRPASMSCYFANMTKLTSCDVTKLDTSRSKSFQDTFFRAKSLKNLNLSAWNMSNADNLNCTFQECSSLTSLDLSGWDTSSVKEFYGLFFDCNSLSDIALGPKFSTSSASNVGSMFGNCRSIKAIDVSRWDMSNAVDMSGMFVGCSSLEYLDVSRWNTSKATTMSEQTDVNIRGMFSGCAKLTADCTNWDVSNVSKHDDFNKNAPGVTLPRPWQAGAFAVYSETDHSLDFYKRTNCELPAAGAIWNGKLATEVYTGFETAAYSLNAADWTTTVPWADHVGDVTSVEVVDEGIRPISLQAWFGLMNNLETCDVSKLDTSRSAVFWDMFYHCSKLKSLDLHTFDTSSAKGFGVGCMFHNCSALETVDVTGWDTSKTVRFSGMFQNCANLAEIKGIEGWNTSSATEMYDMFSNTTSLTKADLTNWNTSNVTTMRGMFSGASFGRYGDVEKWDVSNVTDFRGMFHANRNLTSLDISQWNISAEANMSGFVDGCNHLESIAVGESFNPANRANWVSAPDPQYIDGADGKWYDAATGTAYAPEGIPSGIAATYVAANPKTAFAVYSADDNSLDFYKRMEVPTAGSTFENKTATEVYTGFETNAYEPLASEDYNGDVNTPWYEHASDILSIEVVDSGIRPKSMDYWFQKCSAATALNGLEKIDASRVESITHAFCQMSSYTGKIDLSSWDTSRLTSMNATFSGCEKLSGVDLSDCDLSNLSDISWAFSGDSALKSIKGLDQGAEIKPISIQYLFSSCASLGTIDVSRISTASVLYSTAGIFNDCFSLRAVTLGSSFSFLGNGTLTGSAVGGLPTISAENVAGADGKWYAASDGAAYAGDAIPANKADTYYSVAPSIFAVYSADDASLDFYNRAGKPAIGDVWQGKAATAVYTGFDTATYATKGSEGEYIPWADYASSVISANVVDEGIAPVSLAEWFDYFGSLSSCDLSKLDGSKTTSMAGAFYYCYKLADLKMPDSGLPALTNLYSTFAGCSSLETIPGVEGWDTSKISIEMTWTFANCPKLTADLSSWKVSNVPRHRDFNAGSPGVTLPAAWQAGLFAVYSADDCSLRIYDRANIELPAAGDTFNGRTVSWSGKFDMTSAGPYRYSPWYEQSATFITSVKKVVAEDPFATTSMPYWFYGLSSATEFDLRKIDVSECTSLESTFSNCSSLEESPIPDSWNVSNVASWLNTFNGCSVLKKADISRFTNMSLESNTFKGCVRLQEIKVGENTFKTSSDSTQSSKAIEPPTPTPGGDDEPESLKVTFPKPSSTYITGADGKWYALSDGTGYAPSAIPSGKADTYYASKSLRDAAAGSSDEVSDGDESVTATLSASAVETADGAASVDYSEGIESELTGAVYVDSDSAVNEGEAGGGSSEEVAADGVASAGDGSAGDGLDGDAASADKAEGLAAARVRGSGELGGDASPSAAASPASDEV